MFARKRSGRHAAVLVLGLTIVPITGLVHAQPKGAAVTPQAISAPKGEGSVQGLGESFSGGTSTGGLAYTIPLVVPAGRGGPHPSLALEYSSAAGAGLAGVGWTISVPFIARQTDKGIPRYQDGAEWTPQQDRFVFGGGQELVPICVVRGGACAGASDERMPAWGEGWQYFRARVEGAFLRFFWSPDHRTWRVQSQAGSTLELGVPLDGSGYDGALETDPASPSRIYRWNIAREYDNQGFVPPAGEAAPKPANQVVYRYANIENNAYLSDIFYMSPVRSWQSPRLSDFAHHVRLVYEQRPDRLTSYRRGWPSSLTQRLLRVDVATRENGAARELVRRYHLRYLSNRTTSLLSEFWVEGRCASAVSEDDKGELPDATDCPRQSPVRFSYTEASSPNAQEVPGIGKFDPSLKVAVGAPRRELAERNTDFIDINGDGLLDIVRTVAAAGTPEHSVQFNGEGGVAGSFGAPVPIGPQAGSINAQALALAQSNVVPMDLDGDGTTELLYMPPGPASRRFIPEKTSAGWKWIPRALQTPRDSGAWLDLTGARANVRVMDVNGDGLVDIVATEASKIRTFLNLGRYPGGAGRFGSATWTGPETAVLSDKPLESCAPGDQQIISFAREEIRLADMNGDGLVDIVRVLSGQMEYWPGRGDGSWGVVPPPRCAPRAPGVRGEVVMTDVPALRPGPSEIVELTDVDGDGLEDILQIVGRDINVFFNRSGTGFARTPLRVRNPQIPLVRPELVRIADIDGTGTSDIVFGTAHAWSYVDLLGGARPNLLSRVDNGRGAESAFEYANSASVMLEAVRSGAPWTKNAPTVVSVLRKATVTDRVVVGGSAPHVSVTSYDYRDPVFDPTQREFRGFTEALVRSEGDATHPSSTSRVRFLLGECVDETPGDTVDDCSLDGRFRDNRREALKGLPVMSELFDDRGVYKSTQHTTYRLRHLFTGLDGRVVRHAFPDTKDEWLYDAAAFVSAPEAVDLDDVILEGGGGGSVTQATVLRSRIGRAHVRKTATVNRYNLPEQSVEYGCVDGCAAVDEAIVTHVSYALPEDDRSGWLFRPVHQWVEGSVDRTRRNETRVEFDAHGRPLATHVLIEGTLPLRRFHEVLGRAVAPPPAHASVDGWTVSSALSYDTFGNVTFRREPNAACRDFVYDADYAALPIVERAWVGPKGADVGPGSTASAAFAATPDGAACGSSPLTTRARYDRGLGTATEVVGFHGERTVARFDSFGRLSAVYAPDEMELGETTRAPSSAFTYFDFSESHPFTAIRTQVVGGAGGAHREGWAVLDGHGRPLFAVEQGDTRAGDLAPWIVSGRTDRDRKGAVARAYEPTFAPENPALGSLTIAPSAFVAHEYDAFGREIRSRDRTGDVVAASAYHALSVDAWDAADLSPEHEQSGTYSTTVMDGHGRDVLAITRQRTDGGLDIHEQATAFLPTGQPLLIERRHVGSGDAPVRRWMRYDSIGRLVLNAEPHTSRNFSPDPTTPADAMEAIRYAHDDAGRVVGTSDARGCGVNHAFDAGGRILYDDYSPCLATHEEYSPPDLATGTGTEAYFVYDRPIADAPEGCAADGRFTLGRLVAEYDRGRATVSAFDARGRATCAATRVAKPGAVAPSLSNRYARDWFVSKTQYDEADRAIAVTTGAKSRELLGDDGTSAAFFRYTQRGTIGSVDSSYGPLLTGVSRRADGLVERITYGDLAQTSTSYAYDSKLRIGSVLTYRGPPPLWSSRTANYLPPAADGPDTRQRTLQAVVFGYDVVGNPTHIDDFRDPGEWPNGSKPTGRRIAYDGLNRVKRVDYDRDEDDAWVSPFAHELSNPKLARGVHPHAVLPHRVRYQTYEYDWLGNITRSGDDAQAFFDRSLGWAEHATSAGKPYQLTAAGAEVGAGAVRARYDDAGYLVAWTVEREGLCAPAGATCSHRYTYDWDEVGNLVRARRWDRAAASLDDEPADAPSAELLFAYDASAMRVRKTVRYADADERHWVYPLASLELHDARFEGGTYVADAESEVAWLTVGGLRARVVYGRDLPSATGSGRHVFLSLRDHLGSGEIVIDKDSGELVEASGYYPFGAIESDYRPERWGAYRDSKKFTGKEDDAQLGLVYFGKRYLAPALGRWISPDPLAVHEFGADPNLYAYVSGRVFALVDPLGLQGQPAQIHDPQVHWETANGRTVMASVWMDAAHSNLEVVQYDIKEALKTFGGPKPSLVVLPPETPSDVRTWQQAPRRMEFLGEEVTTDRTLGQPTNRQLLARQFPELRSRIEAAEREDWLINAAPLLLTGVEALAGSAAAAPAEAAAATRPATVTRLPSARCATSCAAGGVEQAATRSWKSFLPQAEQRVAQAYETYGGRSGVEAMARFNEDQAALIDLAKQAQRTGLSPAQADVMRQWAQEHGLLFRGPEVHPGRPFGQFPHVHIGPIDHIPVKP